MQQSNICQKVIVLGFQKNSKVTGVTINDQINAVNARRLKIPTTRAKKEATL